MACNCGKKKGAVNYFTTEQQAKIARERGGVGVKTTATSAGSTKKTTGS